jgi:hypothetical protein
MNVLHNNDIELIQGARYHFSLCKNVDVLNHSVQLLSFHHNFVFGLFFSRVVVEQSQKFLIEDF